MLKCFYAEMMVADVDLGQNNLKYFDTYFKEMQKVDGRQLT